MFKVCNHEIFHIRGDTGILRIRPQIQGQTLADDRYTAVLTMKQNIGDDGWKLQKQAASGKFIFLPQDTSYLTPGDYVYDIEFRIRNAESGKVEQVATQGPYYYHLLPDVSPSAPICMSSTDTGDADITVAIDAIAQGKKGDDGASAYDVAVKNGFIGTEQEWLASLHGDTIVLATDEEIDSLFN